MFKCLIPTRMVKINCNFCFNLKNKEIKIFKFEITFIEKKQDIGICFIEMFF